jgi:hypothetical protein
LAAVGAAGVLAYFLTRPSPPPPEPRAPATSTQAPSEPVTAPPTTLEGPRTPAAPEAAPSAPVAPNRVEPRGTQAVAPSRSTATDEAALLERAREAIASDPKRALALTREHARRFPKGVLIQEREVIAIDALKRLGKGSEADSRADQFKKTYPGSAHQHGLDSATNQR